MIKSSNGIQWIEPEWPAPAQVRAVSTLRSGGVSNPPFASLNLALHVGDAVNDVYENRRRIEHAFQLPNQPCWLQQVHGVIAVEAGTFNSPPEADASYTRESNTVCSVMTADCLPILFCTKQGDRVAAAHAGWRGLVGGVLESAVQALNCPPAHLLAWLGPAIGQKSFVVGDEVRTAFSARNSINENCFVRNSNQRWWADIYALARNELLQLGVQDIFTDTSCTVTDASRFFSYRRDGQTGRMASMIWLQPR